MKQLWLLLAGLAGTAGASLLGAGLGVASAGAADSASTQATSSFDFREQDGAQTIDITNVTFSTTSSHVPGRPEDERLLLRTTIRTREVIDEKGLEATVIVEAWPLGTDLTETPLYAVTLDGVDAQVEDNAVIVFERGTEDVAWQSVHSLGSGAPLFDTFVPMRRLPPSPEIGAPRFVGLDVPPDNAPDPRLRDPKIVGVLAYASPERTLGRLLLTCSDTERAAAMRSYWDTTRALSFVHELTASDRRTDKVLIWWRSADSDAQDAAPHIDTAVIPIVGDDLDIAHADVPACIALAPWSP